MTWLLTWLRRLVLVVMVFNFGQLLLPEGEFRRLTRMVLGLLVTLLLLQPFVSLFHQRFNLDDLWPPGEIPPHPLPTRAAAGIVEAGLAALAAAEKEE
ncbi:MAG: hypothetical protein GX493_09265, partial [Firmicutes bacterium]|nr:hypothetical protein [Bacillota bacterium]